MLRSQSCISGSSCSRCGCRDAAQRTVPVCCSCVGLLMHTPAGMAPGLLPPLLLPLLTPGVPPCS